MGKLGLKGKVLLGLMLLKTLIYFVGCSPSDRSGRLRLQLPNSSVSANSLLSLSSDPTWGLSAPLNSRSTDLSGIACYAILLKDSDRSADAAKCVQSNGDEVLSAHQFLGLYEAGSVVELKDLEPNSEKTIYLIGFGANSLEACRNRSFPLASALDLSAPQLLAENKVLAPGGKDVFVEMVVDFAQVKTFESCDGNLLSGKNNDRYFSLSVSDQSVLENDTSNISLQLSHPAPDDLLVEYVVTSSNGEPADLSGMTFGTSYSVPVSRGQLAVRLPIELSDDNVYEGSEEFQVEITGVTLASDGSSIGYLATSRAVLTVVDDESVPTLAFAASDVAISADETEGTVITGYKFTRTLTVELSHPFESGSVTVGLSYSGTADSVGSAGFVDYQNLVTGLLFNAGEISNTFVVEMLNNANNDVSTETIQIDLTVSSALVELGASNTQAVITINDAI